MRKEEGAGIATALVFDFGRAGDEAVFEGHGQTGRAEGQAIRVKSTVLDTAACGKGDGGKATGLVEIVVDVEGVKGGIEGAELGLAAQALLDGGHQREEEGAIAPVEGLGQFSQDEFAIAGQFGGHYAGSIAPVVNIG